MCRFCLINTRMRMWGNVDVSGVIISVTPLSYYIVTRTNVGKRGRFRINGHGYAHA